ASTDSGPAARPVAAEAGWPSANLSAYPPDVWERHGKRTQGVTRQPPGDLPSAGKAVTRAWVVRRARSRYPGVVKWIPSEMNHGSFTCAAQSYTRMFG